jgi:hypothetical protein
MRAITQEKMPQVIAKLIIANVPINGGTAQLGTK